MLVLLFARAVGFEVGFVVVGASAPQLQWGMGQCAYSYKERARKEDERSSCEGREGWSAPIMGGGREANGLIVRSQVVESQSEAGLDLR